MSESHPVPNPHNQKQSVSDVDGYKGVTFASEGRFAVVSFTAVNQRMIRGKVFSDTAIGTISDT